MRVAYYDDWGIVTFWNIWFELDEVCKFESELTPPNPLVPGMNNSSPGKISMGSSIRFIEDKRHLYDAYENSGVLIYAMQDLFNRIDELEDEQKNSDNKKVFQIKLSYIEIYNE